MRVTIYGLRDPVTGEVRYVGKSRRDPARRLREHVHAAASRRGPAQIGEWLRGLDRPPDLVILEVCSPEEWRARERHWTEQLPDLLNVRPGGGGSDPPPASLKPITVYLPAEEVDELNAEAEEDGRSSASAQIRWILAQRRKQRRKD